MAEKSQKMTKQELRAPDAFQLYGAEASDWLMKRSQLIAGAVVLLIVGGLVAGLVHYFSNRSEEKAAKALGQALTVLGRPVVATSEGLKPVDPGDEAPFTSDAQKDGALKDALEKVRAEHKGTDAARTAALPLGKAYYRLGKNDEALASYASYIDGADKKDPLLASAYEGQGYAHEAKGELDKALESFRAMEKAESGDFLQGMGKYHQARILVAQGKKEEAAQLLVDLKGTYKEAAAGRMATERLAVLASEGVKIPEPKVDPAAAAKLPDAGVDAGL